MPDDPLNPSYYQRGGIEAIEVIEAWDLSYHLGTVVKYIARAGHKNPATEVEDLKKALWYLDKRIKLLTRGKP